MLGWTQPEIGDLFELAQPTVGNIIRGLTQIKTQIMEAFNQGLAQKEIAKEMELSEGRISQILKKFINEEIKEINLVPEWMLSIEMPLPLQTLLLFSLELQPCDPLEP